MYDSKLYGNLGFPASKFHTLNDINLGPHVTQVKRKREQGRSSYIWEKLQQPWFHILQFDKISAHKWYFPSRIVFSRCEEKLSK